MIAPHCSRTSRSVRRQGFTLIELLVVISIIAILMGLGFPAINSAINSARRASAQNDVTQIANAVTMFMTEYGRLPPESASVDGPLLEALMGENDEANPRKIVFLEVPDAGRNRSGLLGGAFVDPWENTYKIALDTDYNNKVEVPAIGDGEGGEIRKTVAVWNEPTEDPKRQQVKSW